MYSTMMMYQGGGYGYGGMHGGYGYGYSPYGMGGGRRGKSKCFDFSTLKNKKGICNLKYLKPSKWGHSTVFEIDY